MGMPPWDVRPARRRMCWGPGAGPLCQAAEQQKKEKERYARYVEHRAERSHRDKADQRQQYGNRKGSLASVTRCLREQSANGWCREQQYKSHESSDPQFEVDVHPEILDVRRQVVEVVVTEPVVDAVFESPLRRISSPDTVCLCLGCRNRAMSGASCSVSDLPVGQFQYQW